MLDDVRYGCRRLARSPGFTCLSLAIQALGIGANRPSSASSTPGCCTLSPIRTPAAYCIAQRAREIGIRVALGLLAALPLMPVLRGSLVGVGTTDPLTYILVPLRLALMAVAATYLPARRASWLAPLVALHYE